MHVALVAALIISAALLGAACDDDQKSPASERATTSATSSPSAISSATSSPEFTPPSGRRTGITGADAAIDAVESHDLEMLFALFAESQVPCLVDPPDLHIQPACAPEMGDGSLLPRFARASCEAIYLPLDRAKTELNSFFTEVPLDSSHVYAVYDISSAESYTESVFQYTNAEHAIIFSVDGKPDFAWELLIRDESVVAHGSSCGTSPADFVRRQELVDPVLPPIGDS